MNQTPKTNPTKVLVVNASSMPSKLQTAFTTAKTVAEFVLYVAMAAFVIILIVDILSKPAKASNAPSIYPGPYAAEVTRVTDGDSLCAKIFSFPGDIKERCVRVKGYDTAETRNYKCPKHLRDKEKALGKQGTDFVKQRYKPGQMIRLRDVEDDKYGGRVAAIVERQIVTGWQRLDTEILRVRPRIADPYGINNPDKSLTKSLSWCKE